MAGIQFRDYQIEAIKKMHNGCILCGGVGSGKSLTALGYYYLLNGGDIYAKKYTRMFDEPPMDLYIITTAKKRDSHEWDKELLPFLLSTNPECNYYNNKVVVDSWNNIKKYVTIEKAFFIFDEQRVVGNGAWVKSFLTITKNNRWILLSATPGDTWSDYIPVFIANGFYRNRTEFTNEHIVYARFAKYPKIDRYVNTKKLVRLRDRVLVDMDFHRDTVSHHEDVICSYDIQKYKTAGKTRWDPYKDEPMANAGSLCYVWRRIVNEDPSRVEALTDIFDNHSKLIVFYNFDYEREILLNFCHDVTKKGFEYAEWSGHAHQPIPESKSWIYLVQYTAGCEGWNCVKTDTIIFYSQNYSYKVMEQAAGRIDRLNTPYKDLWYYHFRSNSGIDRAIQVAIKNKKIFNERRFTKWSDT